MSVRAVLLLALAWLLIPEPVWAWGPATHVALGETVLSALYLVPPAVRALLEAHPLHYLYGSVAADISFGKKYVPEGRHCHNWHVGEEILDAAKPDHLRAVGLGYLSHLAADTIAHNLFVPRQLLLTSTTQAMGHAYWEHRMDVHVGDGYLLKARRVVMDNDHEEADALFDSVLSHTLFSFRTNRRIFRGMVRFGGDERWMQIFDRVLQKSRFDLPDPLVQQYIALSFDYIIDYLVSRGRSSARLLDPVGDLNLKLAKKVRRLALADGAAEVPTALADMADDFFPFPERPLAYWPRMKAEQSKRIGDALPAPSGDVHAPEIGAPFHEERTA